MANEDLLPDRIDVTLYLVSASLLAMTADIMSDLELRYPGILKSHEICEIRGRNGLPHGDYGFTVSVSLRRPMRPNRVLQKDIWLAA